MRHIYIQTVGPCQWRGLLVDPNKQWKRSHSAFEMAVSWESAQNRNKRAELPLEVAELINTAEPLMHSQLLMAFPEHQVTLDNGKAPSQTDVWALLRNQTGLISLAVEGKAGEPFSDTVATWLNKNEKRKGRAARLQWLCGKLKSDDSESRYGPLRYQLFHRTAAALEEAKRFGAFAAVTLVQAFPGADKSWNDFRKFGEYLGVRVEKDRLGRVPAHSHPELYLGWACCSCATDADIALAMGALSSGRARTSL